ncbi:MAG TPA: fumarylacetoacetate hydrolase family protein [Roseomonas sp.]|jgi:2-keto-4-pentenoate hydratase
MTAARDAILAARRDRVVLAPLGALAPADEAAGYALQQQVATALKAVPPAGFKIGATALAMQAYLGLTAPLSGFVAKEGLHPAGATLRHADFFRVGVECEVGIRLGRDIAAGAITAAQAGAAVAEVFPAIEIVEKRYDDLAALGVPTLIADQVFHGGGVTGAPAPGWPDIDLAAVQGRITVDGVVKGEGVGADLLGHPLNALAWLADSGAAHAFGGLKAGQVVFLGSVTPPIWLDGPGAVTVAFEGLGTVSLRFV